MCGIAGFVSTTEDPATRAAAVARMNAAMLHRGPDDGGDGSWGPATLGMRRLAIFDPANGHQPMSTPDGRWHIGFNGASYNFRELRAQLESAGRIFHTQCDTEILPAAFAIWLEDRGPVFFRQTRIGKNHAPFQLIKLRTMRVNAGGGRYTQKDDRRITCVGRFLRASRLDEFPQLVNVLRGEMSMIGPRAEWDVLVHDYEAQIPCYHFRHLVKPGITGWAQVSYPYGASLDDTLRKLEYDLYYIRHFSFLIDAAIVLKTIHIMIFGKGR